MGRKSHGYDSLQPNKEKNQKEYIRIKLLSEATNSQNPSTFFPCVLYKALVHAAKKHSKTNLITLSMKILTGKNEFISTNDNIAFKKT